MVRKTSWLWITIFSTLLFCFILIAGGCGGNGGGGDDDTGQPPVDDDSVDDDSATDDDSAIDDDTVDDDTSDDDTLGEPGSAFFSYTLFDGSFSLQYASYKTDAWVTEDVDSLESTGIYNSIAIDSDGHAHISYFDLTTFELKYANNITGSWATESVLLSAAGPTEIKVDSESHVHIGFAADAGPEYATNASGTWKSTRFATSGSHASLAVDSEGKGHMSYVDKNVLYYATNKSYVWVTKEADSKDKIFGKTSIAVDSNDDVYIAYTFINADSGLQGIKFAANNSGSWETEKIVEENGEYPSLAFNKAGKAHLCFYDSENQVIKYATNQSGEWKIYNLISAGNVEYNLGLAVDDGGYIHIVYQDVDNQDLIYATNTSGAWAASTIVSEGQVGLYAAVAAH